MFCLRSWIPILFFLTNASPIYLVLFISATYFLNRPCVYCSLLLAILVISLFDFSNSWFEPPYPSSSTSSTTSAGNETAYTLSSLNSTLAATAEIVASAAGNVVQGAMDGLRRTAASASSAQISAAGASEWMKVLAGKKEWRISCLDVVVRL